MALNPYFNHFAYDRESDLIEDLIIESIKIYGHEVRYIPRIAVAMDPLFGEDPLSRFEIAVPVEMYIRDVEGFQGEGDFLSKFGVELHDQITFTLAKKRWPQITEERLLSETSFNYQTEAANTQSAANTFSYDLEAGNGNNYSITSSRPLEGDLIYFPLTNDIFKITFVEHEAIFYQTGQLQTYDISCEKWAYSGEQIRTGNNQIDIIETQLSTDYTLYQFRLETGDLMLNELGQSLIAEFRLEDIDPIANNEYFTQQVDNIVDWSEDDPFSLGDRY